MRILLGCVLLIITLNLPALAGAVEPITPGPEDRCPVCGMFTEKFPVFYSHIIFTDGSYETFDGPKDMFKFYSKLSKNDPDKVKTEIESVYTKDYYSSKTIDAKAAYFVLGSEVLGAMGKEAIPFKNIEDAEEFNKDHKGKKIMRFDKIINALLKKLE